MVDATLVIVAIIVCIVCLIGIIVFMVYMQHPEDAGQTWGCKIIVLVGLFLSCVTVLCIPFDVAMKGSGSYASLGQLWYACYIAIGAFAFAICPFASAWYETDETETFGRRLGTAICWCSVYVFVFSVLTAVMYITVGFVNLPVTVHTSPLLPPTADVPDETLMTCNNKFCVADSILKIQTSAAIYILAMLTFFGWFLTCSFGGIGLTAIPLDLINGWRNRPVAIDLKEFATKKKELHEKVKSLQQLGKEMQAEFKAKPSKTKEKVFRNKFKTMIYEVEQDYENLQICFKEHGGNPIIPVLKLVLGVFSIAIALSWVIQVILTMFLKGCDGKCPFLNSIFIELNGAFPLLGTGAYGAFAFYLLWAVIKGCMKFGMRFFLISIYPMKVGGTLMNAFLFNVSLILLCTAAIVQFCTTAFAEYARLTAVSQIFVTQVQYLIGLEYFYAQNIFYILFLAFAFLSGAFSLIQPMCAKAQPETLEEAMAAKRGKR